MLMGIPSTSTASESAGMMVFLFFLADNWVQFVSSSNFTHVASTKYLHVSLTLPTHHQQIPFYQIFHQHVAF
jgi:hypothetical protein